MKLTPFLCLAGTELSNDARTSSYATNIGIPGLAMPPDCACSAYNEGYSYPHTDPAPWYEPNRPESADFLGFYAYQPTMDSVLGRQVTGKATGGAVISGGRVKNRLLVAQGLMMATTARGMAYGEAWVREVLRGSVCDDGSCAADELIILPACPEDPTYDADGEFRHLVNVGVVDGPVFSGQGEIPQCLLQQASFQLSAGVPYLFHPGETLLDAVSLTSSTSVAYTTPQWMGDGVFVIALENTETTSATDITVTGRISLDGTCYPSNLAATVEPSFTYSIPELLPGDRIVIDGRRSDVYFYDASYRSATSGLPKISFDGPFLYPEVGPCTTMCLTLDIDSGEVAATVNAYLREL